MLTLAPRSRGAFFMSILPKVTKIKGAPGSLGFVGRELEKIELRCSIMLSF